MVGKQVRVDNWGIYFLQRLQVFFSKTDFCDLTLQFQGNVQLKVHRLVMNACTDYFNFLERNCPGEEGGTIIMPPDLQSEVIVPIVNFMYTGMLEFQIGIFEELYKAAELMNITVLTKLLDAQRSNLQQPKPVYKKKSEIMSLPLVKKPPSKSIIPELPPIIQGRKLPVWKRSVGSHHSEKYTKEPSYTDNSPKPTRFEWPEDDLSSINMIDSSFEVISYTSKPLLTREEETRGSPSAGSEKRHSGTKYLSIKEETSDSDGVRDKSNGLQIQMEDIYEENTEGRPKRRHEIQLRSSPKKIKMYNKENSKETTINVKSSTADLDHTKIVSEILKKYPNLVKKNKNIKLKIMPVETKPVEVKEPPKSQIVTRRKAVKSKFLELSQNGPWSCAECQENGQPQEFVLYYLYRKHMTDVHNEVFDIRLCKYCGQKCSKHNLMMYHLYTKHGLRPPATYVFPQCEQCPYIAQSQPKLAIHKKKHNINERQCEVCELAFTGDNTLTAHMQITGHISKTDKSLFDCQYCTKKLQSPINLLTHIKNSHLKEGRRDGIVSLDELEEVDEDNGEEEVEEPAEVDSDEEFLLSDPSKDKVKILSNIKVENKKAKSEETTSSQDHQIIPLESNQQALNNVAGNLGLGLVDIVVLDDNQQYILRQDSQSEQTEFILPDLAGNENTFSGQVITTQHNTGLPQGVLETSEGNISSTDELVMVLTDRDYQEGHEGENTDNSNIVVLYSHPVDGQQGQFITSQGNLLMNSQTGMLELRDGTAITTTADQMVVNNTVDTPIESIEMIQREIESHQTIKQEQDEQVYVDSSKQILQSTTAIEESPQLEMVNQVEIPTNVGATEQETQVGETQEQEQIVGEQEQIIEEQEHVVEQEHIVGEQEETVIEQECIIEEQENQNVEVVTEEVQSEVTEEVQDSVDAGQQEDIPMEIDGLLHSGSNLEDTSGEVQQQENQEVLDSSISSEETDQQTTTDQDTDVPPSEKRSEQLDSSTELDQSQDEVQEKEAMETSDAVPCETVEAMEVDGVEHTAENTQEEFVEETEIEETQSEVQVEEGKEEEAEKEAAVEETLPEWKNDDKPTGDNQEKSEEESNSRLNIDQAILEDWEEDTDSQQSEKKSKQAADLQFEDSGDNEEFKQNEKRKKAADNVNKLMDDWEEEDEDDKKDA